MSATRKAVDQPIDQPALEREFGGRLGEGGVDGGRVEERLLELEGARREVEAGEPGDFERVEAKSRRGTALSTGTVLRGSRDSLRR